MAIRQYTKKKASGEEYQRWGYDFYDDNGKRHRLTNCKSKGQAETELKRAYERLGKGQRATENKTLTFKKLSDDFLEYHAKVRCKETTYNWYKKYINKHLLPFFGEYRVVNITPSLINKFLAEKKTEERIITKTIVDNFGNATTKKTTGKYGIETINHCLVALKAIFNEAVKNELISKNPAANIKKLKKEEKEEMEILAQEELFGFLKTAEKHYPFWFYVVVSIAALTGLREGEILGLCWDKIDFDNKKIKVHRSVYEGKLRNFTKTSSSYRLADMPDGLILLLKKLKSERKLLTNLVFPNSVGKPILASNMIRRQFHPCLRKSGIAKNITFHCLRHTYVSIMYAEGVPMKYLQCQVGHSSITTTMNTYEHLLENIHKNAVNVLDKIMNDFKESKSDKNTETA